MDALGLHPDHLPEIKKEPDSQTETQVISESTESNGVTAGTYR